MSNLTPLKQSNIPTKHRILVLIETSREFGRGLLKGISQFSEVYGPWNFFRYPPYYIQFRDWKKTSSWIKKQVVDGIIMWTPNTGDVQKLGVPTVLLDVPDVPPGCSVILTNNEMIGEMAANYFMERCYHNFAFCGFSDFFWSQKRCKSFVEELKKHNKEVYVYSSDKSRSHHYWEDEKNLLIEWLNSLPKPVALLTCNDDRGQDILDACRQANIRVPEDVSVLGVDNDELVCNMTHPQLSSIAINTVKAGFEAARHLEWMINNKSNNPKKIFANPIHIITRHSTDIVMVQDSDVSDALRFIQNHVREQIQVVDVAEHLAVTREGMNKKFRKYLGRSVHDEIIRVKINYIIRMLMNTNMTISEIAYSVGYTELKHLSRVFRKITGMSPSQYRKQYSDISILDR